MVKKQNKEWKIRKYKYKKHKWNKNKNRLQNKRKSNKNKSAKYKNKVNHKQRYKANQRNLISIEIKPIMNQKHKRPTKINLNNRKK